MYELPICSTPTLQCCFSIYLFQTFCLAAGLVDLFSSRSTMLLRYFGDLTFNCCQLFNPYAPHGYMAETPLAVSFPLNRNALPSVLFPPYLMAAYDIEL